MQTISGFTAIHSLINEKEAVLSHQHFMLETTTDYTSSVLLPHMCIMVRICQQSPFILPLLKSHYMENKMQTHQFLQDYQYPVL